MKAKVWLGFVALCVWAGSAWLYDLFAPGVLSGLPRMAVHNGMLALACLAWSRWRRERIPTRHFVLRLAMISTLLFALPGILLAGASSHLSQSTEVLVFMLVPAVVVFWAGQQSIGFGAEGGAIRGLLPALAGLGGAALILPFDLPPSLIGRAWLTALVVSAIAAGIAAVEAHRLLREMELATAGSIVFGVIAVLAASFCWVGYSGSAPFTLHRIAFEVLRLFAADAPILLLGLWLLREMRPAPYTARLFLIPAVTVLEGIVAERPEVGWYGWAGLALTVGAGLMLASMETDEQAAD